MAINEISTNVGHQTNGNLQNVKTSNPSEYITSSNVNAEVVQDDKGETLSVTKVDELTPLEKAKKIESEAETEKVSLTEEAREEVGQKVAQLNDYMQTLNRSLKFQVDEESGETVVKVIDSETEEMVRQIPSEDVLSIRSAVDKYKGLLLKAKV